MLFAGLNFSLQAGESLLLRGSNGVGKSSMLRMMAGLLPCPHGTIERTGRFALADENLALDSGKRLMDALSFWVEVEGASRDMLERAMAHYSLTSLADIPVRMLSTGQRKRAILARTMASDAPLWLLDEPGNGLDSASLEALGAAMTMHLAQGGAIIAASHFDLPHSFTQTVDLTAQELHP